MMPPNPQRPPPSPQIGGGMPNRADQLRMGAEQTLPPPPPPRRPPPGGPPPGGIASLMGGPPPGAGGPPPGAGGAEEAMGMLGAAGGEGEPAKEEIALGLAVTVNEVTGSLEEALNMLADAGDLLINMQGEGAGGPPPGIGGPPPGIGGPPPGGGEPNRLMELGLV